MTDIAIRPKTVLVVEDDPEIGEMMELAVSIEGYSVTITPNQSDALDVIRATETKLILLDYYGVTTNMTQFIARIRELNSTVPIVLVTGAKEAREKAKSLNLQGHLSKPFASTDLFALLRQYCGKPASLGLRSHRMQFSLF